mmetsp:Transcript_624/g.1057  ORF Transcript_624/g.1057 Transcript_624/m.1057 type:complete len:402 (+) Transcript_624:4696-5901(+)
MPRFVAQATDFLHQQWPSSAGPVERTRKILSDSISGRSYGLIDVYQGMCVGHARTQPVVEQGACAIVSVVIAHDQRSRGLGVELMSGLEKLLFDLEYTYMYLWTSDAMGFYAKCGFVECESVNIEQPILRKLEEKSVSLLEKMLRAKTASAQTTTSHESPNSDNVIWMKKRLREAFPSSLKTGQDVEQEVLKHCKITWPENEWGYLCYNVPLQRQIGPSCGLAAIRMVCEYFKRPLEGSLLDVAIERGFTTDGEMFDIDRLCTLLTITSDLAAKVCATSTSTILRTLHEGKLIIFPYDRGLGDSAPSVREGHGAHYCVIVGYAVKKNTRPFSLVSVHSEPQHQQDIFLIAQHGMGKSYIFAPIEQWIASNKQLKDTGLIRQKFYLVENISLANNMLVAWAL